MFTLFGFGYFGCAQYYLYVNLFSRWFAGAARFADQPLRARLTDFAGQRAAVQQILFDLLIHPQWVFRDGRERQGADSAGNFARRSPFPMINILRTPQVRIAQRVIPTGHVYLQNEATLDEVRKGAA